MKITPNLQIFTSDSFGVVQFCGLRGEGRRDWERRAKNGMRMKHMITLD